MLANFLRLEKISIPPNLNFSVIGTNNMLALDRDGHMTLGILCILSEGRKFYWTQLRLPADKTSPTDQLLVRRSRPLPVSTRFHLVVKAITLTGTIVMKMMWTLTGAVTTVVSHSQDVFWSRFYI